MHPQAGQARTRALEKVSPTSGARARNLPSALLLLHLLLALSFAFAFTLRSSSLFGANFLANSRMETKQRVAFSVFERRASRG